jgi:hypothetical protein
LILRGYNLQHEESIKLNPQDLEVSLPKANLDVVGEEFTASCIKKEVDDLVQSFVEATTWVIVMILVNMS